MSLDVSLMTPSTCPHCGHEIGKPVEVFWANITHNLNKMAQAALIYDACWRPELLVNPDEAEDIRELEHHGQWSDAEALKAKLPNKPRASDLIGPLTKGLASLKAWPEHYKQFDSPNGWGLYEHFVPWVEKYLRACEAHPEALVEVSR